MSCTRPGSHLAAARVSDRPATQPMHTPTVAAAIRAVSRRCSGRAPLVPTPPAGVGRSSGPLDAKEQVNYESQVLAKLIGKALSATK